MTREKLERLALHHANEILQAWWYECKGEVQDDYGLTDEEMKQMLAIKVQVIIDK
jgi:hypothetical protein